MGIPSPAAPPGVSLPGELVPVAFFGRTSTLIQNYQASMRRQLRKSEEELPPGFVIVAHYWDIESGGLDLDQRGHAERDAYAGVSIPRDGGMAALLAEAQTPSPRFAAVICEDIERSARDTFSALKLEKDLGAQGIPLFATDEPISVAGMNATTVLIRRVKQGVAEWFRLQLKEKAWAGFREHTLDGWNIGTPPYGYLAEKHPHPNPAKRAEGRTKTRLIRDPVRAPVVGQMFTWRAAQRLGVTTIRQKLNADRAACPPPRGEHWTDQSVYQILANPKYTGHMVWGRTSSRTGRWHRVPPEQWVWSSEPTHPAIVTRETYETARQVTLARASEAEDPAAPGHPLARRTYELRSRMRCRICHRRMQGTTRATRTYYTCPHDASNPRHAGAYPDHPKRILVREDHLVPVICEFFATRIFGHDRAALLCTQLPENDAAKAAQREKKIKKLHKEIRRVDNAQKAKIVELEKAGDASDPATEAWRDRLRERFAELVAERKSYTDQLAALTAEDNGPRQAPELLDTLPALPARLQDAKPATRARLYQAFDLQLLYNKEMNQVTIYATITTSTPGTIAAILSDSEPPSAPARYPFPLANSSMGSSSALRCIPPAAARDGIDLRDTPYAAGPAPSLTEPVRSWPLSPTQVSDTVVPGWYCRIRTRSEAGEVTAWPFTAVITSPAAAPAFAAGAWQNTPAISVPDLAGAMLFGTGLAVSLTRQRPLELMPWPKLAWAVCRSWPSCVFGLPELLGALFFGSLAIAMPMNAGWPIWIVLLPLPLAICRAIDRARAIGIE